MTEIVRTNNPDGTPFAGGEAEANQRRQLRKVRRQLEETRAALAEYKRDIERLSDANRRLNSEVVASRALIKNSEVVSSRALIKRLTDEKKEEN